MDLAQPESDSVLAAGAPGDGDNGTNVVDGFSRLPDEIAVRILGYLHSHVVHQCAQVSRSMNRLAIETALDVHFKTSRPADRCVIFLGDPASPTPDALHFLAISCHIRIYSYLEFYVRGSHPDRELQRVRRLVHWAKAIPRFNLTMGISALKVIDPRYRQPHGAAVLTAFGECMNSVVVKCHMLYLRAWHDVAISGIDFTPDASEFFSEVDAPEDFATRFPAVAQDDRSHYIFEELDRTPPLTPIRGLGVEYYSFVPYPQLKSVIYNPDKPLTTHDITLLDTTTHFLRPPFSKWFFPLIQQTSPGLTLSFPIPLSDEEHQFIFQRLASAPIPSKQLFVVVRVQHSLSGILVGLSTHFGEILTTLTLHAYLRSTAQEKVEGLQLAFSKLKSFHVMPWIIEKMLDGKNKVALPALKSVTLVSYAGNDLCDLFDPYTFAKALEKLQDLIASSDGLDMSDTGTAIDSEDSNTDLQSGTHSNTNFANSNLADDSKDDRGDSGPVSLPDAASGFRGPLKHLHINARIDICAKNHRDIYAGLDFTMKTGFIPADIAKSENLVAALKSVKTLTLVVPPPKPSDQCRSVQQGLHKEAILAFLTMFSGVEELEIIRQLPISFEWQSLEASLEASLRFRRPTLQVVRVQE